MPIFLTLSADLGYSCKCIRINILNARNFGLLSSELVCTYMSSIFLTGMSVFYLTHIPILPIYISMGIFSIFFSRYMYILKKCKSVPTFIRIKA